MASKIGSKLLQEKTQAYLVEKIRQGRYKPGDLIPTFQELADKLSVSTTVTFRAVKNMRDEGWLEQGYKRRHVISERASQLVVSQKNANVAFTSRGIDHILLNSCQAIFNNMGRMVEKFNINLDCILELDERSREKAIDTQYDVIVASDWELKDKSLNVPVISIDSWEGRKADYIIRSDNFKGGRLMGEYLYKKGYRKIIYWDAATESAKALRAMAQRRLGFLKGWIDEGGHWGDVKIVELEHRNQDLRPLINENIERADVFFGCSDAWALKIWDFLNLENIKVPDDIALAGYDGIYEALTHEPPLTTVTQPYNEYALKLTELIVQILSNEKIEQKEFVVEPALSVGSST